MESSPRSPPAFRRRTGSGEERWRAWVSLIGTSHAMSHGSHSLTSAGSLNSIAPSIRSRSGLSAAPSLTHTSPPRSSRLCATTAAAHSMRALPTEIPGPPSMRGKPASAAS